MTTSEDVKDLKDFVFGVMCVLSQNFDGEYVFSSATIARCCQLSKYEVLKALRLLREDGLVQSDCVGRPAIISRGECDELVCDAMPPLRGFSVTKNGKETDVYKQEEIIFNQGLEEWENGYSEQENREEI